LEFGPGFHPLPLGPLVTGVQYCDTHDRATYTELFPDAAAWQAGFPEKIHYRLDFERDDLVAAIGSERYDFVVASHVLEHLVNPLRFLRQCYDLLVEGGQLYLAIPDKRKIFDADRERTALSDVVRRYENGETDLEEEVIRRFVNEVGKPAEPFEPGRAGYEEEILRQRRRSIHVNVWILDDLLALVRYLGDNLDRPLALLDGLVGGDEIVLLLRKTRDSSVLADYPAALARILAEGQTRWSERRLLELKQQQDEVRRGLGEILDLVRPLKALIRSLPGSRWLIGRLDGRNRDARAGG